MKDVIQIPSAVQLDRFLAAQYCRWYAERLAKWNSWLLLNSDGIANAGARWWKMLGSPTPPLEGPMDFHVRTKTWVWETRACPDIEVFVVAGGGAVVRLGIDRSGTHPVKRWAEVGDDVDILGDSDLSVVGGLSNNTGAHGVPGAARRARAQLGFEVDGTQRGRGRANRLMVADIIPHADRFTQGVGLAGRWKTKLEEVEAAEAGPG